MIEFKWHDDPDPMTPWLGEIIIDGERQAAYRFMSPKGEVAILLDDPDGAKTVLSQRIESFEFKDFSFEGVACLFDWWSGPVLIKVSQDQRKAAICSILVVDSLEEWRRPWSFADFRAEFLSRVETLNDETKYFRETRDLSGHLLRFTRDLLPTDSLNELRTISERLRSCYEYAEQSLAAEIRPDSVVAYFDFPSEVRTACGQY